MFDVTRDRVLMFIVLAHVWAGSMTTRASVLPIINPSFEDLSRPLAVGEQTNGAGGAGVPVATRFPFGGGSFSWDNPVEVPGWRTYLPPMGSPAFVYAGALNPPMFGDQPFITGQDGQNVVALQVSKMGQALDVLLEPNTRYELSFLGGIGLFGSDYFLGLSLIAVEDLTGFPAEGEPGVTRLAITQGLIPPEESFGTLLPYSLEYTTPATLPPELMNRYIGINLFGSDGIPRVVYDDFKLTATTVPEPATISLLAATILGVNFGRRFGLKSRCKH